LFGGIAIVISHPVAVFAEDVSPCGIELELEGAAAPALVDELEAPAAAPLEREIAIATPPTRRTPTPIPMAAASFIERASTR
jgi:hypothetical protein